MNQSTECLDEASIDSLLQGHLAPHECQLVQEHLENCEQCRNRVESTIGSQQWWEDIASSLSDGAATLGTGTHRNADGSGLGDVNDQIASLGETRLREKLLDLLGPTDDPDMLGRIGSYEIVGLLGQGGMGVVFKGFDRSLNRFVAIKMLLPHLAASGAARKRFAREAQAVAAVVDDHVMAIHCVDQWQGVPYLVMTYSRGITLQKRLSDNGPLEVREILRIGMQAAKGLAAAHAQGIVHRDIKPANIFLDQNVERVQLMDFGLARAVDDASLTRTGVLAGTPQYMSPEQARAESVDHRSDLFSLGSVMYAMCTGHAPFRAESSYSVLRLITDKEPRPIREVNPDVPDWLCSIIAKLMAKQGSDRFISANQVAELFQVCLAHLQSPTTTAMPAEFANVKPGRSSSKFHQLLTRVFAMCCLSLLAILLVMQNVEPPTQTGLSKLEKNSQPSQSGNPLQVSASDSGQSSEVHQSIADDSVLMISVDSVLPASDQGHPFIVKNSSIFLPSLDKPILVSGRSMSEIESAISEAYLQQLKVTTKTRIHEVRTTSPATVINVNQKSVSGIWRTKQIISAGQVVPPDKAPGEFVFRRNQMIWKFTGKIKRDDVIFDVELDVTKSPIWITLRSQDPKRPQPVLGLIDFTGHELRIFTKRDAKGNPSTERPTAIGTGNEPGTDLMILELKSFSVDEMKTYSIDEYVSNLVAQWKKSSNDGEPSEEAINAKVTEVGNKLAEDIDGRYGPCNLIEFDATSNRLIIDHTPQAHQKIEAFLKESIATSFALLTLSEQPEPEANAQVRAQTSSTEVTLGQGPDMAELLETAAKHEEWFSKMRSVHFRAKGKNVQSEKALEVERAKLIARGADAVVPIKSPSLLPSFEFSDEIAWDGKRVANIRKYSLGLDNSHWVWDGTQSTTFQDGTNAAYILNNEQPSGMETPLSGACYWPFDPRFALRTKSNDNLKGFAADDFTLHTPDLFHGVRCYRLVSIDKQIALFIAVDSGLMIGKREGILTEPIVPILKSLGHDVKNAEEARKLLSELEPARLMEVRKAGEQIAKKIAADTLLNGPTVLEAWVSDFQPTPLGVFPMKHYRRVSGVDADVPYERYRSELEVVELKTNEPIDSTLFEVEFRNGVTVVDNRFETPITYSYDSKMTSEDLKALVRKSLESSNELDALVGKPLPALTNLSWINSESRDIASFKGRPLIVECWAVGCGPCHSHFATLNSLNEAGKIQVIGFHTATKDVESITRFAQDLKLGYPIVVDTGDDSKNAFGPLPVTRMPYTILVDASGTIVAHGDLDTLLPKAFEMVASNKPAEAQRQLSADDGQNSTNSAVAAEFDQTKGLEAAYRNEQQAQEIANLPRFYLYSNLVSDWLDGMSDEADTSEANFERAMNERLKPDTPSSTRITAWDEKRFLFGYDAPNLDGARGNTRIVNHYFSHENSFWQRQKTNKDAPQYSKLELPYVWKKVDANAFFHLRSARLEFPWGNTDGNIKFALVPLEFAEYQAVGEENVDGAKCWVVMSKPRRCKLWLDQKSGRLMQMLRYVMQGVESTPFQETPEVEKLCGRKFDTLDAFHEFGKATDRATFQRLAGLYGSLYFDELAHPIELTRFSDYREIAPGVWFPHQATDVFAGHSPSDNNKFRFSRGELRVITLETGRSLEETIAAFVSELPN